MTIKNYCKSIGFEIVGKLTRKPNIDKTSQIYTDEIGNEYLRDTKNGTVCIVTVDGAVI